MAAPGRAASPPPVAEEGHPPQFTSRRTLRARQAHPHLWLPEGASVDTPPWPAIRWRDDNIISLISLDAGPPSRLSLLSELRAALLATTPSYAQLQQLRTRTTPINGNRLLMDLQPAAGVQQHFRRLLEHLLQEPSATGRALRRMLQPLTTDGRLRLLGSHRIIPFAGPDDGAKIAPQKVHCDVSRLRTVIGFAVNAAGHPMHTLLDASGDGRLARVTASAFAFDTGCVHAAPGYRNLLMPLNDAYIYLADRTFFLVCGADISEEELRAHARDNGLQLSGDEPSVFSLPPAAATLASEPMERQHGATTEAPNTEGDQELSQSTGEASWSRSSPSPHPGQRATTRTHRLSVPTSCGSPPTVLPPNTDSEIESEHRAALDSFTWPISSTDELRRLLNHTLIAPTILCGMEFSGAMSQALSLAHARYTLSVDTRRSLVGGMHYLGDIRDVLAHDRVWEIAFFWPPCTHQTVSDTRSQPFKLIDGRSFWGISLYIYVLTMTRARLIVVEQPDTIIHQFYQPDRHTGVRRQRLRPSFFGDSSRKPINLTIVGGAEVSPPTTLVGNADPLSFFDFDNAEERDRWRSSWARFPNMVTFLAATMRPAEETPAWAYRDEIETFAVNWHAAGYPVPTGYEAPSALPPSEEARAYQSVRGDGHGRLLSGVLPHSLQRAPQTASVASRLHEWRLANDSLLLDAADITRNTVLVVFIATSGVPLVLAHADGLRCIGVEFASKPARGIALRTAMRIAQLAAGSKTVAYLAGTFSLGPVVAAVPLAIEPAQVSVVASSSKRRLLAAAGYGLLWCTLGALAEGMASSAAMCAVAATEAFIRPVRELADTLPNAMAGWGTFSFGATQAADMIPAARLVSAPSTPWETALHITVTHGEWLRDALSRQDDPYLAAWAAQILPPPLSEIPPSLLAQLPTFVDTRLDTLPLPGVIEPYVTEWLHRLPPQRATSEHCPKTWLDLYKPEARASVERRARKWLHVCLTDLLCIERLGDKCERRRPRPLAIGSEGMWDWAKGIVFDFTFERHQTCGVPLDFGVPIQTDLNLTFLRQRLHAFPDQRLVSFLLEGVSLEALVESHSVWIPHLTSLPSGFTSVRNELQRLGELDWYRFFDHIPMWPLYFNGQGATARKLETRFRRTTEGGGPRELLLDETGLRAWSINDASKLHLTPAHLRDDARPEMRRWLRSQNLPAADPAANLLRGSKWPAEIKPSLDELMRYLSVLRRAAEVLNEPIYIFSDDARDFFNQLALRPESWHLFNVAFLHEGRLRFISERRLGFGCHPASKIAQRFSDALLYLFREDMDSLESEAEKERPLRPAELQWRASRAKAATASGRAVKEESRLYAALCFADDPVIIVIGVTRAVRALQAWRQITQGAGLIMAIEEKRVLGAWAKWLGILIFTGLGVCAAPRAKLLRAAQEITTALDGCLDFGRYRSLVGFLEHLRCVNRAQRNVMYGLYEPHKLEHQLKGGPSALVQPDKIMQGQLHRWLRLVQHSGGVSFLAAVTKTSLRESHPTVFVASADAATDCEFPGLGGFLHGKWWYFPVSAMARQHLHITVLELLATGFNAIVFAPILQRQRQVVLLSDALATPFTLTRQSARSPMLSFAHQQLLSNESFNAVAAVSKCGHLAGDSNVASDACSRWNMEVLSQVCAQWGISAERVTVPEEAVAIFDSVLLYAINRGVQLRGQTYVPRPPAPPEELVALGQEQNRLRPNSPGNSPLALRMRGAGRWSFGLKSQRPGSSAGPTSQSSPASSSAMQTVMAAGLRLAAQPSLGRGSPRARTSLAACALREAATQHAAARAANLATSPFFRQLQQGELAALIAHTESMSAFGLAAGTIKKDEQAWQLWQTFAGQMGFAPQMQATDTQGRLSEVATLLSAFLLFIYPRMRGKSGRAWAKPSSAFQIVLAVIRIFKRWEVPMPAAKSIKGKLSGLLRSFTNVYGSLVLAPKRKEPMLYSTIQKIFTLADGTRLGRYVWDTRTRLTKNVQALLLTLWRTGMRLGDVIGSGSGERTYATWHDTAWCIDNMVVASPLREQLRRLKAGDLVRITSGRTKTDQFGICWSPLSTPLPFRETGLCAARCLRDLALSAKSQDSPIFADEHDQPLSHALLDRYLHELLLYLFDAAVAETHSWHSMRIGLACAMHAAGATDAEIMLHCRWASEESLKLYRRIGDSKAIRLCDQAEKAVVDRVDMTSIPIVDESEGFAALHEHYSNASLAERERLLVSRATGKKRARDPASGASEEADEDDNAQIPPASDLSPLRLDNATGRRVLVLRAATWPSYDCDEHGGLGWEATIQSVARGSARVHFLYAATTRGLPYADENLTFKVLRPL